MAVNMQGLSMKIYRSITQNGGAVRHGFSLIELLVVVSVIAVLFSLLASAVPAVREGAYSTRCRSNVRQMVMGGMARAQDFNGYALPRRNETYTHWPVLLKDYLESNSGWAWSEKKIGGSIFQDCPGWRGRTGSVGGFGTDTWSLGYQLNAFPGTPERWSKNIVQDPYYPFFDVKFFRLAEITRTDSRVMFFDADDNQQDVEPVPSRFVVGNLSKQIGPRHRGGNSWGMWSGRVISRYSAEQSVWRTTSTPQWQWGVWGGSDMDKAIFHPEQVDF
jgi:prepilin-type N-terminal cleavage/methylation domain-containing protein